MSQFPHTLYLAAGTQADRLDSNKLIVMKLDELHKTKEVDSDDSDAEGMIAPDEAEESDGEYNDPIVEFRQLNHPGSVNRVKVSMLALTLQEYASTSQYSCYME